MAFISCNKKLDNITEYKQWFNEEQNGSLKKKNIGNLNFTVQYRPVDLMVANELETGKPFDENKIIKLRESYGHSMYFLLEVGIPGQSGSGVNKDLLKSISDNYTDFADNVNLLSFKMDDYVELIVGEDTLSPTLYHYERAYELGNKQKFLFAFAVDNEKEDATLVFYDEIFGTGKNNFKFNISEINVPELPVKNEM